jgi:hypothetical protein
MAGSARYTAILDANVLYPTLVRDLLLSLATAGLYHARWSRHIHDEWTRNLIADRPDLAGHVPDLVAAMNSAVPDCLVENYQPLIAWPCPIQMINTSWPQRLRGMRTRS